MLDMSHREVLQPTEEFPKDSKASRQVGITCLDDRAWDALVDGTPTRDVYFRPGYVRAYETAGHGKGIGLLISIGGHRFLMTLLLRTLSELPFGEGLTGFDAVTPYGFGGLLHLSGDAEVSHETMRMLFDALRGWCADAGVVSVMIRLHPLLEQEGWFNADIDGVTLRTVGPTVALDLQQWDPAKERLTTLHRGRHFDLNHARRYLNLTWASEQPGDPDVLRLFRSIYEERMGQLQADQFYYFPPEYYTELMSGVKGDIDIAFAWMDKTLVGAEMFMAGREIGHAHLCGTNELGRVHKATTLLKTAGADWARRRGCRWLHIGGGTHGADHLLTFKKSFGGTLFHYSFVTFVADSARYQELTSMRLSAENLPAPRSGFFPEYRA